MPRFRSSLHPINSRKNVVDTSQLIMGGTSTVLDNIITGVDQADLASDSEVNTGSKVSSFFMSFFGISEGGELANEVPLIDWYIIYDPGGTFGTTFDATHLPTPGATGIHQNKRFIIHEEKGLSGGGDLSLAGVPMVFKGVLKLPRGRQRVAINDRWRIAIRTNFNTKVCSKFIYKWYS